MIFSSEVPFLPTKDAGTAPSESVVTMPVSVGHRQPAFTAVVGEATRREQILTDEDGTGETTVTPTELMIRHFGEIQGLDGSEGQAQEVDRGIALFRAETPRIGAPPSRGREGQSPGPMPAGSLSSARRCRGAPAPTRAEGLGGHGPSGPPRVRDLSRSGRR